MNEPVTNVYFTGLKDNGIVSTDKSNQNNSNKNSTDYIILQNDHLHQKVQELQTELTELKQLNDELESDNGSLETSKTSLKGYIRNEAELNIYSRQLVSIYDTRLSTIPKIEQNLIWDIKRMLPVIGVLELAIIGSQFKLSLSYKAGFIGILDLLLFNLLIGLLLFQIYVHYKEFMNIKYVNREPAVCKLKTQMKEASKGNDYLGDLVDIL
jgi:hypothetical protein